MKLKEIILFKISHFGMNPVRGGRPPRERIVMLVAAVRCGEVVHKVPRSLIVVDVVEPRIRKIGVVLMV